jgi:membrane-bound metal-dependent hydrolase YbcI (DUF457 family)
MYGRDIHLLKTFADPSNTITQSVYSVPSAMTDCNTKSNLIFIFGTMLGSICSNCARSTYPDHRIFSILGLICVPKSFLDSKLDNGPVIAKRLIWTHSFLDNFFTFPLLLICNVEIHRESHDDGKDNNM